MYIHIMYIICTLYYILYNFCLFSFFKHIFRCDRELYNEYPFKDIKVNCLELKNNVI